MYRRVSSPRSEISYVLFGRPRAWPRGFPISTCFGGRGRRSAKRLERPPSPSGSAQEDRVSLGRRGSSSGLKPPGRPHEFTAACRVAGLVCRSAALWFPWLWRIISPWTASSKRGYATIKRGRAEAGRGPDRVLLRGVAMPAERLSAPIPCPGRSRAASPFEKRGGPSSTLHAAVGNARAAFHRLAAGQCTGGRIDSRFEPDLLGGVRATL